MGVLSRSEQRATNDLVPLMPPFKAEYVFGGMPEFMCRVVRGLLPDIKVRVGARPSTPIWLVNTTTPTKQGINAHGVARVGYMLKVMQPMVAELGQAAGQRRHEALKAMEHCKSYYQLLALSTDALLQQAASAPTKYSAEEWMALVNTQVPGRSVTAAQKQQMSRVVGGQ